MILSIESVLTIDKPIESFRTNCFSPSKNSKFAMETLPLILSNEVPVILTFILVFKFVDKGPSINFILAKYELSILISKSNIKSFLKSIKPS